MLQNPTPNHGSASSRIVPLPRWIGNPRKPIDRESLHRKQDHCHFNDDEFFGLRDDAERNDEGRGSCRRMAYPKQRHERTGS